jgi:Polyketide cyclase / dehydrase and lipid transport
MAMTEYELSRPMPATTEIVFDTASRVEDLDRWLPDVLHVEPAGANRVHAMVAGRRAEGLFRADRDQLRLEWGAYGTDEYAGWLQVADSGAGASEVTLHLSLLGADQPDTATVMHKAMAVALDRLAGEVTARSSSG